MSTGPIEYLSPLSNITPFTYRDGETYLERIMRLHLWMTQIKLGLEADIEKVIGETNNTLGEFNNGSATKFAEFNAYNVAKWAEFNATTAAQLIEATAKAILAADSAELAAETAELMVTAQDGAVKAIVGNTASEAHKELTKHFVRVDGAPINVLTNGVKSDGSDQTVAIQNVIDLASASGVKRVFFPSISAGYTFSTLTVPSNVGLFGDGYTLQAQDPFGHENYDAGDQFAATGTVLRSTATAGNAITIMNANSPAALSGFCLVGPGVGTSTGIAFEEDGSNTTMHHFENVMVANFNRCWYMYGPEDAIFINLKARGCVTGFHTTFACNQNTWLNCEVQFSEGDGFLIHDSTANQFIGMLVQNASGRAGIRFINGESNTIQGLYHETGYGVANMLEIQAGSFNVIRDLWCSGPVPPSLLSGGQANRLENWDGGNFSVVATGGIARIDNVKGLTLTGDGAIYCMVFQDDSVKLGISADLRIGTGKTLWLENTGTSNFIRRSLSTGDTQLGTGIGGTFDLVGPIVSGAAATGAVQYLPIKIDGVLYKIAVQVV